MARKKVEGAYVDPHLAKVEEPRGIEIVFDEENYEVVFVCHYRRKWGDEFDADIDHGYTLEATNRMILVLMEMVERLSLKVMEQTGLIEKSTPEPKEGNPAQGGQNYEGK